MKNFIVFAFFAFLPSTVFAHAFPTSYSPDGFSSTTTMPSAVVIRFSQTIAPVSNGIEVFTPDGTKLPDVLAVVDAHDAHVLSRALSSKGDGIYVVSWHGVSAEDGHFTKGAFSFFVGTASATPELYGGTSGGVNTEQGRWPRSMIAFLAGLIGILLSLLLFVLWLLLYRERSFSRSLYGRILGAGIVLCMLVFGVLVADGSPPTAQGLLWSVMRMDGGRMIIVSDPGEGEHTLRLRAYDAQGAPILGSSPTVLIDNAAEGIGPLLVPAKERGAGAYDIPGVLFTPPGVWRIAITFTQKNSYDINATIGIDYPRDIVLARSVAESKEGTILVFLLIGLACAALMLIVALVCVERKNVALISLSMAFIVLSSVAFLFGINMKNVFSSSKEVLYGKMEHTTPATDGSMPDGMAMPAMQM